MKEIPLYKIVRVFYGDRNKPRVIKERVTLEEAQAHCSLDSTIGPDWYDGIQKMRKARKKKMEGV